MAVDPPAGRNLGCPPVIVDARDQLAEIAAIVASADDAIVGTREGVITSWNPGAERLYGYAADEAIGQPITLVLPPESNVPASELLERLRRGETVEHFESVRVR